MRKAVEVVMVVVVVVWRERHNCVAVEVVGVVLHHNTRSKKVPRNYRK